LVNFRVKGLKRLENNMTFIVMIYLEYLLRCEKFLGCCRNCARVFVL